MAVNISNFNASSAVRRFRLSRSNILSSRVFSSGQSSFITGPNWQDTREIPVPPGTYGRARVILQNDTATPFTMEEFAVSSGRAYADLNPLTYAGLPAPWSTSASTITAPAGSATNATDGILGWAASDWLPVTTQPRSDGGKTSVLHCRARFSAGGRGVFGGATRPMNLYSNQAFLRNRSDVSWTSAAVLANQTNFNPATNDRDGHFHSFSVVEFMSSGLMLNIACTGDSVSQGYVQASTNSNHNGFLARAADTLANAGQPVSFQHFTGEGKSTTFYFGMVTSFLNTAGMTLPQLLVIQPFSQNNGTFNMFNVVAAWDQCMDLANLCLAKNVIPMLRTCQPTINCNDLSHEVARNWVNTQVRNSGFPIFDMDAALSDGNAIARIKPGLTSDGAHLTDDGNEEAASQFVQDLAKYILI
jgi:lysophospholipase L1-like esterase